MHRFIITGAIAAALGLSLVGCGGGKSSGDAEKSSAEKEGGDTGGLSTNAPAATDNTTSPAATGGPSAPAQTTAEKPKTPAALGQELFMTTCAACHGRDAKGMPGLGKDMTKSDFIASTNDEDMLKFIKKGRSVSDPMNTTGVAMLPKGGNPTLTDDQLRDIIAFMRTVRPYTGGASEAPSSK